jgi:hypothetical protein
LRLLAQPRFAMPISRPSLLFLLIDISPHRFNGQRVALREQTDGLPNGVVYWLHGDHLASASLTTDATAKKIGELRYKPYGETRFSLGDIHSSKRWTGQRSEESLLGSLYDFNARFCTYIE